MANFAQDVPKHHQESVSEGAPDATSFKREFGRENSAFQLIVDTNEKKILKCKMASRVRRSIAILMVLCAIGVLCTMTALYISERQRRIALLSDSEKSNFMKQFSTEKTTTKENHSTSIPNTTPYMTSAFFSTTTAPIGTTTTAKPLIKPLIPGCVPVFDAFPLPTIPPEIQNLKKHMDGAVESLYKSQGFKAASVAFSYRGKIWWSKHVGKLNYSEMNSSLPDNDTPYPVASITKLFTTFMLHKLSENGQLKLDDPVKKHVPEFSIKNPFNNEPVTLRQLSCMMSGLPRESPCYPHTDFNFCPYNSSVMWKRIANLSLVLPPDKNPSYSNLGYSVLGRALERVVGEKYEDWMMKNIIKPLGMNNSAFDLLSAAHRFPVSTNIDESKARIIDWGWQLPAAGLYSSINDLNQVAKLLFELLNTTVLHRSTARQLFKPAFLYNTGHGTGYGFEILNTGQRKAMANSQAILEYLVYAKSGASLGYGSLIALIPEFKLAIFILTAHGGKEFVPQQLFSIALAAVDPLEQVLVRSLPKYVLPPSPESFVGNYSLNQYWPLISNLARIFEKQGVLYLALEWLVVPLSYDSPWTLITGHFKQYPLGRCEDWFLGTGLSNLKCYFDKPLKPGQKSPGFHVYGFTAYGFAEFKRVD